MAEGMLTLSAVGHVLRSAEILRDTRGPGDVAVSGVSQDSRTVSPGELFLAWEGDATDAHDFVEEAVARGAVAVVVERPVETEVPQLVTSNGRLAAALAADAVLGSPWRGLTVLGVTGTNGKTTTALLVRHVLAQDRPTAAIGTLGVVDDDGVRPGTEGLTTPGPVQLSTWLRQLADAGVEAVVMEASSHALTQFRLDGVRFGVGVFTNLSQDHLDYHGNLHRYLDAKARLVDLVAPEGVVVLNRDDPAWASLKSGDRAVIGFSLKGDAEVIADGVELGPEGSRFALRAHGEEAEVRLPLLGRYNVENALAAAAAAVACGLTTEAIARALGNVPQIRGRLELIHAGAFTVLIDFAHTPDALDNALEALRPLTRGRLVVVFGAGGDRDRSKRRPMAEVAARRADRVILTSDNPRTEDPERILDDLEEGLSGASYDRTADRRDAIWHALAMAQDGDTVLLAGKGHETYQVVGTEKHPFDERAVVHECLAELGAA